MQYGWMYPIERLLCTLKRFVRNNSRPEGSVVEAYIANECLTFCSRYLDDIVTRFNRPQRNVGDQHKTHCDVFGHGVNFLGAFQLTDYETGSTEKRELRKMAWYVLNNCDHIRPYTQYVLSPTHMNLEITILLTTLILKYSLVCRLFRDELKQDGIPDAKIERRIVVEFERWFQNLVSFPLLLFSTFI